eukprot:3226277-Prymnesium_polylepis.1
MTAALSRGADHRALRDAWLQAAGAEALPGVRGAAEDALLRPGGEEVLPVAAGVHALGAGHVHGVGGQECGQGGPSDARRDQPAGVAARHHPRRLLDRGGPQYLPRLRLGRKRGEGDCPLVRRGGAGRVGGPLELVDLRVGRPN